MKDGRRMHLRIEEPEPTGLFFYRYEKALNGVNHE
jgi:hypothetical protein